MLSRRFPFTAAGFNELYGEVSGRSTRELFGIVTLGRSETKGRVPAFAVITPSTDPTGPSIITAAFTVGGRHVPIDFSRMRLFQGEPILEHHPMQVQTDGDISPADQRQLFDMVAGLEWRAQGGTENNRYDAFQRMAIIVLQLAQQHV